MTKKILALFTAMLLLGLMTPAQAAENKFSIVPSVAYGLSNLNFQGTSSGTDISRSNTIDFALTAAYNRFYMRVNMEIPLGEEFTYGANIIKQFKREDFGFAGGYYLLDNLSIFGGFSQGKTSVVSFSGSNPPVYEQHLDTGPFFGANYNIFIGDTATISVTGAYASMTGAYLREDLGAVGPPNDIYETGSTAGFSFGLAWSDTFRGKANYFIAYKMKNYSTTLPSQTITKNFNIFSLGFVFPI